MNAAKPAPVATGRWKSRTSSTPNTTAAIAARFTEPRQVGFLSRRSARRVRAIFFASSRVWGRPVRPARSIVPAGVPRCLRVRFFLVCATTATLPERPQRVFEQVALGREPAQRHVLGKALESAPGREAYELGFGDL